MGCPGTPREIVGGDSEESVAVSTAWPNLVTTTFDKFEYSWPLNILIIDGGVLKIDHIQNGGLESHPFVSIGLRR
jgi:hypothetical protein